MGRKITIQNINTNEIKSFNSISNCVTYLNNIAPSNKSTLYRYIELKKPYHGFICKWENEVTTHIKDKAIKVSITDISDGKTVIYSSLIKAALSFAPYFKTTGSTIKAFANNGELFKEKYKITIITEND